MTVALLAAWIVGVLALPLPRPSPADLHFVFNSEFIYLASTRTTANEWWLRTDYPYEDVRRGASAFTDARDSAYQTISSRRGRVYIVDLKPVRQYMDGLAGKAGAYRLGLLTLFPAGYPGFTLDAVEMSTVKVPCNTDQLFYFRAVDTDASARKQPFTVTGQRHADGTYLDAVVTTPLFTLKAPKVRIVETGNRMKIQVLARVK